MRAVVYPKPNEILISDVPVQKPREGEALVRIKSTTICGTDLKILAGKFPATKFPHIPGHEWSGDVVEVGPGVSRLAVGDKVAVEPHVGCGACARCLEGLYNLCQNYGKVETGHAHIGFTTSGGLAEYCTVSVKALHKLPENMSYDQGAFTESVGVALYAIERASINPGDSVALIGPGAIGLIAVQIAKGMGGSNIAIFGTREERLELGRKFGADVLVNVRSVQDPVQYAKDQIHSDGYDVVVEFAGTEQAASDAIKLARRGGRVSLAGATSPGRNLNVDLSLIVRGHLNIYGALADPKWVCERAVKLISSGLVNVAPLMSGDYKLDEYRNALEAFEKRLGGAYRIMIHP